MTETKNFDITQTIRARGITITITAEEVLRIINQEIVSDGGARCEKLDLTEVTVEELELETGATTKKVFDTGQSKGFALCPLSTILEVDQIPCAHDTIIAMRPVDKRWIFFTWKEGDKRYLDAMAAYPDNSWHKGRSFIFVRPS